MPYFYNSLIGLLKNSINETSNSPAEQKIKKPSDPTNVIVSPPRKAARGISPCEPILSTLVTLPNLSLSIINIIAVFEGILNKRLLRQISLQFQGAIVEIGYLIVLRLILYPLQFQYLLLINIRN